MHKCGGERVKFFASEVVAGGVADFLQWRAVKVADIGEVRRRVNGCAVNPNDCVFPVAGRRPVTCADVPCRDDWYQ